MLLGLNLAKFIAEQVRDALLKDVPGEFVETDPTVPVESPTIEADMLNFFDSANAMIAAAMPFEALFRELKDSPIATVTPIWRTYGYVINPSQWNWW